MNSPTQAPTFGVEAGRQLPFSEPLDSVDQAPVALRASLADWLERHTPVCPMIFTPAFATAGLACPASVFAVSAGHWLWLAEEEEGAVRISTASHAAVRSIAIDNVLLQASLQVQAANARARILFNFVGLDLFLAAVRQMLAAAPALPPEGAAQVPADKLDELPFKLRSALKDFIGDKHALRRLVSWPQGEGGGRTIPAGLLVQTDRHLCLLRDGQLPEAEELPSRDLSDYGKQIVWLSRASRISWTLALADGIAALEISAGGGKVLDLAVSEQDLGEVEALLASLG